LPDKQVQEQPNVRVRIVEDIGRDPNERYHYVAYDADTRQHLATSDKFYPDREKAAKAAAKAYAEGTEILGADEVEDGLIDYPDGQYTKTMKEFGLIK
jgi:hypothetical protein